MGTGKHSPRRLCRQIRDFFFTAVVGSYITLFVMFFEKSSLKFVTLFSLLTLLLFYLRDKIGGNTLLTTIQFVFIDFRPYVL